jgi:hypothetical protein
MSFSRGGIDLVRWRDDVIPTGFLSSHGFL